MLLNFFFLMMLHVPTFKNKQKITHTKRYFLKCYGKIFVQLECGLTVLLMQDVCQSDCRMGASIFLNQINLVALI